MKEFNKDVGAEYLCVMAQQMLQKQILFLDTLTRVSVAKPIRFWNAVLVTSNSY